MHPVLLQIGPFTIHSYGVMLACAVLVCAWLLSRDSASMGIGRETIYDFMLWAVAGGIIGARLYYALIAWDHYAANPWEIFLVHKGGLAWQGSFVGGTLAGIWFVRRKKLPLRPFMDLVAPYIALGQSIGRIGCFLNGCCFGKACAFGVYFPVHQEKLFPAQLLETLLLFIIFVVLKAFQKRPHAAGQVFALYLVFAGIERFAVEFVRADHQTTWLSLSQAQFVALGVLISGLLWHRYCARKP